MLAGGIMASMGVECSTRIRTSLFCCFDFLSSKLKNLGYSFDNVWTI